MTFLIKIKHLAPTDRKGKRFKASSPYSDATMTRAYEYRNAVHEIKELAYAYFDSIRPGFDPEERTPENFSAELVSFDDTTDVVLFRRR